MTNPMVEQGASQLMGGSAMPPEQHGEMPEQNLKRLSEGFPRDAIQTDGVKSCSWRRVFVVGFALLISAFAIFEMRGVFLVGGLTPIEYAVLVSLCYQLLLDCLSLLKLDCRIFCSRES